MIARKTETFSLKTFAYFGNQKLIRQNNPFSLKIQFFIGLIQNQVKIKYTSTFQALCLVTKEEGFKRLYRGLSTPLVTVAFYNAVTFGVYAKALKHLDHISIGGQNNDLAKHTIAGLTSGIARVFMHILYQYKNQIIYR